MILKWLLAELFEIFAGPSIRIPADAYLTLNLALPLYLNMIVKLYERRSSMDRETTLGLTCGAALKKLNEYYVLATNHSTSHSSNATICDPTFNLQVFDRVCPESFGAEKRRRAKEHFTKEYGQYRSRADEVQVGLPAQNGNIEHLSLTMS